MFSHCFAHFIFALHVLCVFVPVVVFCFSVGSPASQKPSPKWEDTHFPVQKWHPTLPLLAYTATYSGRRDVYLMDLSPNAVNKSPTRLTYWDVGSSGVNGVVGWIKTGDGSGEHADALVFRAVSNDISLPDYRLYVLHLSSNPSI